MKLTVPFPLPLDDEVIVIQGWPLLAVHAQPEPATTVTEPVPPEAGTDAESGEIANVHPSPCTIVTVWPAMVSVPDRGGPVSAVMLTVTVPDPLPFGEEATVIHD